MVVSVVAIETDDILSTYPLPQSGELSAFFSEHTTYDCFDMNASDAPAENLELSKGHMIRGWINQLRLSLLLLYKPFSTVPGGVF